jgi:myo-inositol catabolism protein IolS
MHYRQLGRTGIIISEIGFGAWGIGGGWGKVRRPASPTSPAKSIRMWYQFF